MHSLCPGGTERLVIELVKRLESEADFSVCCLDERGAWAAELSDRGIEVTELRRAPGIQWRLAREIAALVDRHRATTLHCHQYTPFFYGRLTALLRPHLELVFTEHGRLSNARPSPKRRLANLALMRLPGRIFAVSADLRRHMIAEGYPGYRVRVVRNGIDPGTAPTDRDRERARAIVGVPTDRLVIGTVARLDPVKNLEMLIAAASRLRARIPQAFFLIVGSGPEGARLQALTHSLGLEDVVLFLGNRNDVRHLLPGFDVYVNCSTSEGISVTILEAMAAKLPVIATRVGGNEEIVLDGHCGFLVPLRPPDGLIEAIAALAAAPARRRAMGEAGRVRAEREFNLDRMASSYLETYRGHRMSGRFVRGHVS